MFQQLKSKRIMLVVAHPDDELLGPGGTMHRLAAEHQCTIRAIILGEGITSRSDKRDRKHWKDTLTKHKENIENARKLIGYESVGIFDFPDNRFDSVDLLDIVKTVENEKAAFAPEIIFTHHGGDLNIDHRYTFEAVMTACRPLPNEKVKTIITFETPSGTEWQASNDPRHFAPNLFFEIGEEDLRAKIQGMQCYEFERREFPHPRSPQALQILAQRWGIAIGTVYAEAFMLIRNVFSLSIKS
ncbi:MAG: PIG-L deacetylase family protein [Bacteroidota bacterium]